MTFKILFAAVCILAARADETAAVDHPTLQSRIKGAFFGAMVADALCLGTHYEYDAVKIKKFYGAIDTYYAPGEKTGGETHGVGWGARNFHNGNGNGPPKRAGEGTDYGDYTQLMLEHLAAVSDARGTDNARKPLPPVSLDELLPRWQRSMRSWRSWMCTQTRQALQKLSQGAPHSQLGGYSNAMSVRFAAALGAYDTEQTVVDAARTMMFTHQERTAHLGNEFFARVAFRVSRGAEPRAAIEAVAAESNDEFVRSKVKQALDKVDEATDPNSALSKEEFVDDLALTSMARLWDVGKSEPIKVGKASPTEGTMPGAIYFIVKYAGDFAGAVQANAAVGGDNAARSVAVGVVMGAAQGVEGIPKHLRDKLVEYKNCDRLLNKLPLLQQRVGNDEL